MKQAIPFKGQILNRLSAFAFEKTEDILPSHVVEVPHPNVTIAKKCDTIPIEIVMRRDLTGHAWREYTLGKQQHCVASLTRGMREQQKLPKPSRTHANKATEGQNEENPEHEMLDKNIVTPEQWALIREKAMELFQRGTRVAAEQGLILVDTKYEMGYYKGELPLIDEVHTSDSSRYFYLDGYQRRFDNNLPQKQLSKEFLREWLMDKGFRGQPGDPLPDLPDSFRWSIYQRYAELYETLTGEKWVPARVESLNEDLNRIFSDYLRD